MSKTIEIEFFPEGFAECLQGFSDQIRAEANAIAARAEGYLQGEGSFHVEMSQEARFQDAQYGVTRPVARVYADDAASKEEAENKILSKAVGK